MIVGDLLRRTGSAVTSSPQDTSVAGLLDQFEADRGRLIGHLHQTG